MSEFTRIKQRIETLRAVGNPVPLALSARYEQLRPRLHWEKNSKKAGNKQAKKKRPKRAKPEQRKNFYRTREWVELRYDILSARGARCECCGVSPREGARMNVDHIVPVSKAWDRRLDPTNLQVLCAACNQGKGAPRMDDWRQEQQDKVDRSIRRFWAEHGL